MEFAVDEVVKQFSSIPAVQVVINHNGNTILKKCYGFIKDTGGNEKKCSLHTLFDLASVSKLFVATVFMKLCEQQIVSLDQKVCTVFEQVSFFYFFRSCSPFFFSSLSVCEMSNHTKTHFKHLLLWMSVTTITKRLTPHKLHSNNCFATVRVCQLGDHSSNFAILLKT